MAVLKLLVAYLIMCAVFAPVVVFIWLTDKRLDEIRRRND